MSNMILTEGSFIEFVFLHSDTLGNMTSLSTSIRPNNINHQEKRHHSRRGAPTKAQHKGSKEIQCRSKKYSSPGLQNPPPKGVSRLDFAVLVAKSLWRPNEQASSRKVKKIISVLVSRLLMFHVWGAPTQLVKRRRWRGRSSKCQQPSLSMMILLLLVTANPCQTWCSPKLL